MQNSRAVLWARATVEQDILPGKELAFDKAGLSQLARKCSNNCHMGAWVRGMGDER
jgi:hypothetical protein